MFADASTSTEDAPIVFNDREEDSITVSLLSGCQRPITDSVTVRISSFSEEDGSKCYERDIELDSTGVRGVWVPAHTYSLKVTELKINDPLLSGLDLNAVKDNIVEEILKEERLDIRDVDSVDVKRRTDFVYKEKVSLEYVAGGVWGSDPFCTRTYTGTLGEDLSEDIYKIAKDREDVLHFKISEEYTLHKSFAHQCPVEEAELQIVDNITKGSLHLTEEVFGGTYAHRIDVGEPNVYGEWASDIRANQKGIFLSAHVDDYPKSAELELWALIEGKKKLEDFYVTAPLAMPLMVVHDPPGDESYAYLEGVTTTIKTVGFENLTTNNFGGYISSTIPFGTGYSFIKEIVPIPYLFVETLTHKIDEKTSNTQEEISLSFSEKIQTGSSAREVGEDADIILGIGRNYVLSEALDLSLPDCNVPPEIVDSYVVGVNFGTAYKYSIYDIRNHMLPTLDSLIGAIEKLTIKDPDTLTPTESALINERSLFEHSKDLWGEFIRKNAAKRRQKGGKHKNLENISFSGSVNYEYAESYDSLSTVTSSQSTGVSSESLGGVGIQLSNKYFDVSFGASIEIVREHIATEEESSDFSNVMGFVLEDGDNGDFFTVDVSLDKEYGTFLFQTISGRSNCPHEANTQSRSKPKVELLSARELKNLPPDEEALYKVKIFADSDSHQGDFYGAMISSASTGDGTKIRIGNFRLRPYSTFYLPYGDVTPFSVLMERGPGVFQKEAEIYIMPDCDYGIWAEENMDIFIDKNNKSLSVKPHIDIIKISAEWQTKCSRVDILNHQLIGI